MSKNTTRISDIQERELAQAIATAIVGLLILVGSSLIIKFMGYISIFQGHSFGYKLLLSTPPLVGAIIIASAGWRAYQLKKVKAVEMACPFCDSTNHLPAEPTDDFDCDHCNRTIHFDNGKPIPARTVKCPTCASEHRVSVNVTHYLCDRCNRTIELNPDPQYKVAVVQARETGPVDSLMQNFDVLLVGLDQRAHETDLAFKLQNLMVISLPEARKLLTTATPKLPVIVAMEQPTRKAESLKRQLTELGGVVTLRPTMAVRRSAQRA